MEYGINSNIENERKETPMKQYKVIIQLGNGNEHGFKSEFCKKNSSDLQRIQQNYSQRQLIHQNNMFAFESMEKQPESFIENAKTYQLVGYKIMKSYNPKKQKKKYHLKRSDSGTSRLSISKLSSTRSIPEKWFPHKDHLLEEAEKIEGIIKKNQSLHKNDRNNRFYHSKDLLENFNKIWQKKDQEINQKLRRKEKCSLVSLSSAYREKIQTLEENSLRQKINNIGPADWLKTLREETKLQNLYNKKFVQKIHRVINCQRREYLKLWDKTSQNNKFKDISLSGNSKLKKEINWATELSKKKFQSYNQRIF